jgi:2-polyprenyl-3-methyl-5-hydroxy-6-metoxy-1,4-benzoquinol methylase
MSLEEQVEKCQKIHDFLAEYWNWVYYDTPHSECSWLTSEYVKQLKPDVERRVPVVIKELEQLLRQHHKDSFSMLDVGCGVGGFIQRAISTLSKEYSNIKFKVTGIDISSKMIEYASQNLRNMDVELVCDSITNSDLKFKNEPFDVAVIMVTLSFYNDENAKEILRAIKSRLTSEGHVIIMDFAWTYRWKGAKLFSKPLQKLTDIFFSHLIGESFHFNTRTEKHLKDLIRDAGLKVTKCYLSEKKSKMRGMLVIVATKEKELPIEAVIPETAEEQVLAKHTQ